MAETKNYDVIVLGAGPGGYVSAIRASQLGMKAAIIDKQWLGGVCLNVGCIPSKALLRNADLAYTLRERTKEFGISFDNLQLDYAEAVKRSRKVSKRLTTGVGSLMKKNNVDVFMGEGRLVAKNQVTVKAEDGSEQVLEGKNIIISTGATAVSVPGIEVDGEKVLTYLEAILQEKRPETVVIIGAGAIGMEFATIWSSYGTKVTLVEMLPRVLPLADAEISDEVARGFKKAGIEILTGHKVLGVDKTEAGVQVRVSSEAGEKTIEAEQALMAIGFKPNSKNLGLEEVGVAVSSRGFIEIDERMATNVEGIWAVGDVTGKLMLAHVASAMGIVCAENIAGVVTVTLDYRMMPSATYCHPQSAWFGYTEEQAKEAGYTIKVGKFPFMPNGKALGLGDYAGFVKIITDEKYGEILGAHMVGPEVTELLPELTLAQRMELTTAEIARNVHAHPTLSEVIMEAAHAAEGHAIHI